MDLEGGMTFTADARSQLVVHFTHTLGVHRVGLRLFGLPRRADAAAQRDDVLAGVDSHVTPDARIVGDPVHNLFCDGPVLLFWPLHRDQLPRTGDPSCSHLRYSPKRAPEPTLG